MFSLWMRALLDPTTGYPRLERLQYAAQLHLQRSLVRVLTDHVLPPLLDLDTSPLHTLAQRHQASGSFRLVTLEARRDQPVQLIDF